MSARRRRKAPPTSQLGLLEAPKYESAQAALADVIETAASFGGRRGEWSALRARVAVAVRRIGYDVQALDGIRHAVAPVGSLWARGSGKSAARWQVTGWEGERCCLRSDGGVVGTHHGRDLILGAIWRRIT